MKKIAVLSVCFISFCAGAQNIRLEAGKKITGVTTSSVHMDMGAAGGEMKMESSTTSILSVISADDSSYKADNTITKMSISEDGGGQNMSYNSENKADTASEAGKEMSSMINKPLPVTIDKKDGSVTDASPEKPETENDSDPFGGLMGGSKSPAAAAELAFFVLPAGKNLGDKWIDSTSENGLKVIKTYELQSLKNGVAAIGINSVTKGTLQKEAQGLQLDINLSGTSITAMTTDIVTGLVQKITTKGNLEGTLDMMGQSMPVTMTISSESVFNPDNQKPEKMNKPKPRKTKH